MNQFDPKSTGTASRQLEIVRRIAEKAHSLPLLEGGLWFHDDIRNNFYYASYLFAAAADSSLPVSFDREKAAELAQRVLREILLLQNTDADSPLYSHWPLWLEATPREAPAHVLPVEIMGSLMLYFRHRYGERLDSDVRERFDAALRHVYRGGFYRKPLANYNHHEAKYTAAKLIFGRYYQDRELMKDGRESLKSQLQHLRSHGMEEYGALPWFWHWVQAFTCALELTEAWEREASGKQSDEVMINKESCEKKASSSGQMGCAIDKTPTPTSTGNDGGGTVDSEVQELLADLKETLDLLWRIRAEVYLRGAWVGAHSRGWPHDVPRDANVLHDYVQFGDFPLPEEMPRTEYAGFLFYAAPVDAVEMALRRTYPTEVKKRIVPLRAQEDWHSYAYITEEYAAGGLWERVEEFDNEQLRWAFTLPVQEDGGGNRLYFFHPGGGYREGDPRHQSGRMEVLYHRSVIAALFPRAVLGQAAEGPDYAVGILPKGIWLQRRQALFGLCGSVFFAVYLSGSYDLTERKEYLEVKLEGLPGGVVMEAVSTREAAALGMESLDAFAAKMELEAPEFVADACQTICYRNLQSEEIVLSVGKAGDGEDGKDGEENESREYANVPFNAEKNCHKSGAFLNGERLTWEGYSI
ncbi:hypothetical protein [Gorillibacterium timonense]|uniref:hypothetical protein n=1 Tax=Gorillibacterium timonense TaxID=1689269 RepID=UPI00071DF97C|nr:hypothetical protein [Gorillibacterium timonense]